MFGGFTGGFHVVPEKSDHSGIVVRMDHPNRLELIAALHAVDGAGSEPVAPSDLASAINGSPDAAEQALREADRYGLCLAGLDPEYSEPVLLDTGRQFLAREGHVEWDVLAFLPHYLDDLYAREALIHAGSIAADEFRHAILAGDGVAYAREVVPVAFAEALDEGLALDLYGALLSLLARLSNGAPAGCVAEEILAVHLMNEANIVLEGWAEDERITADEVEAACGDLKGLFELFQDDDVLNMFRMKEPGDAALMGHSFTYQQTGVADQRVEAWFKAFGGTTPTGRVGE